MLKENLYFVLIKINSLNFKDQVCTLEAVSNFSRKIWDVILFLTWCDSNAYIYSKRISFKKIKPNYGKKIQNKLK